MFTSLAANDFFVTVVASNHFDPGAYSNTTNSTQDFGYTTLNATTGREYGDIGYQTDSHDIQQFLSLLEGYNASNLSYEDLTPSQCANLYNTDFVSNHRNLFLIANHTSTATFDNTLLDLFRVSGDQFSPDPWLCPGPPGNRSWCDRSWVSSMVANKRP